MTTVEPRRGVPLGIEGFVRSPRLALTLALALSGIALTLVLSQGLANMDLPVKAAVVAVVAAISIALAVYRPMLFPFVAFVAAVPFDNLLQTGGGTITKFLGLGSAIVALLVMVDRRRTMTPPIALAGWAVFLAWSVASLMWANDPAFGLASLVQVVELFALCAILAMVRVRIDDVRWMFVAAVAGGVACSAYGIVMYVSGHVARTDALSQRLDISLGSNAFINADHFSGALVFPIAIALVGFLRLNGWQRIAAAGAFVILLGGVLISATRGSLVAVGVLAVYLAFVERRRLQLLALGGIGLLASLFVPNIWLRFLDSEQGGFGGRSGIWAIGLAAFRHHWLLGAGTGNFRLAYAEAYLNVAQRGPFFHRWAEDSHNLLVNTGVELGVVGLVLILAAWVLQFRTVAKIPRDAAFGAARSAIEAGTLGLFVVAMALDLMWYKYLWIAFMLGMLARNAWLAAPRRTIDA
jgi:O-antigen ligase